jgi:hypothetical protein
MYFLVTRLTCPHSNPLSGFSCFPGFLGFLGFLCFPLKKRGKRARLGNRLLGAFLARSYMYVVCPVVE